MYWGGPFTFIGVLILALGATRNWSTGDLLHFDPSAASKLFSKAEPSSVQCDQMGQAQDGKKFMIKRVN